MSSRQFLLRLTLPIVSLLLIIIGISLAVALQPRSEWASLSVPLWSVIIVLSASAAIVMIGVALLLQRRWIGPLQSLTDAANRLAAEQWQTRVDPGGAEEVRLLGNRFNLMAANAQKQVADLNHQRADLQALVDSLPDSILLGDSLQRIVVINTPAAKLLQLTPTQAVGKKIDVVVNEEAILSVIDQANEAAPVMREIRLQRGGQRFTYQAVVTKSKAGGVLLVLRNISAMAATVQMKTDFVANASHELRTPIAAIKAAFETLQEVITDDPQQTIKCVNIIAGHLKRLEEMLADLLDLSRVESPDLKAHIAPVDLSEVEAQIRATMGAMAQKKLVELAFEAGDMQFNSDRRLLSLVLRNLVENAIKFTPPGGRVTTKFSRGENGTVLLKVIDTGIGIPPEHRERVFERFYQVDPARSGAAGRGTGLGLAIVKHAVHALGGTVSITSEMGKGTTVTCELAEMPESEDNLSAGVAT